MQINRDARGNTLATDEKEGIRIAETKTYALKHFDTPLLRFAADRNAQDPYYEINWVNEAEKHLLHLGAEATPEGVKDWAKRRNIPKNRAFAGTFLARNGLNLNPTQATSRAHRTANQTTRKKIPRSLLSKSKRAPSFSNRKTGTRPNRRTPVLRTFSIPFSRARPQAKKRS